MPELSNHTLFLLLQTAAELGAKQSLCKTGKLKPYLSKSQAFREYGRSNIEHWIELGLITPRKDGAHSAAWRIDRIEADTIRHATELFPYL
jgi:hypothetical protein